MTTISSEAARPRTRPPVSRVKSAAADFPVPQSKDETVAAIAEIGRRERERDRIQAAMNDELATIRERWEREAAPHNEAVRGLSKGVQLWCEAHRDELTEGGKVKTASLASGEVSWRLRPPSVGVRGPEAVIASLKMLGLGRFVRIKEEVNREAILAEPKTVESVKGISLIQIEDFIISPFKTDLEEIPRGNR